MLRPLRWLFARIGALWDIMGAAAVTEEQRLPGTKRPRAKEADQPQVLTRHLSQLFGIPDQRFSRDLETKLHEGIHQQTLKQTKYRYRHDQNYVWKLRTALKQSTAWTIPEKSSKFRTNLKIWKLTAALMISLSICELQNFPLQQGYSRLILRLNSVQAGCASNETFTDSIKGGYRSNRSSTPMTDLIFQ